MIEIMCEHPSGPTYHAYVLNVEVPHFKTEKQAEDWCKKQDWKGIGRDGAHYELSIHIISR